MYWRRKDKQGERRNWIVLDIKQRGKELGQIAIKKGEPR